MGRMLLLFALGFPLSVSGASQAKADPVTIDGGSLYVAGFDVASPSSTLTGTDQFTLITSVAVGSGGGFLDPLNCRPCQPLEQWSLDGALDTSNPDLARTSITLRGIYYDQFDVDHDFLVLIFGGIFTVPAFAPSTHTTVRAPFTMNGLFFHRGEFENEETQLQGHGTATVTMKSFVSDDFRGWDTSNVRYDFGPVPEPSSLVLLGSGLLGAIAARRRHNARRI